MTISDALKYGSTLIGRRDTMLLINHVTGESDTYIFLHENTLLPNEEKFLECVKRRQLGEPLQYIIGQWDFMGRTIKTDHRALIPRPETELLVEEAAKFLKTITPPYSVLDLCTGSGCIAIAMAAMGCNVTAADISSQALELARENGSELNINFIQSNLFSNITSIFDIIISNPPYITTAEMNELSPTVRAYEPNLALHGGHDGMDIYRQLIPQSLKFLNPGGALFLEIGPTSVKDIMIESGFKNVRLKHDYAGLPRIIWGISTHAAFNSGTK